MISKFYWAHLTWSPQCGLPNFIFNVWFILTYPINLPVIHLAFAVIGGRCKHYWRTPIVSHPQIFSYWSFTYFQNFVCLAWAGKNSEEPAWGGLPNCSTWNASYFIYLFRFYLSFIFTYSESFMYLAWMVEKFEFAEPIFGAPNFVKFDLSFLFACVSWNCDVSSLHK